MEGKEQKMNLLDVLGVVCTQYARMVCGGEKLNCISNVREAFRNYHKAYGDTVMIEAEMLAKNEKFLDYVCDRVDKEYSLSEFAGKRYPYSVVLRALHEYEERYNDEENPWLDDRGMTSLQRLAFKEYALECLHSDSVDLLLKRMNELDRWVLNHELIYLTPQDINTGLQLMDRVRLAAYKWMPENHSFAELNFTTSNDLK